MAKCHNNLGFRRLNSSGSQVSDLLTKPPQRTGRYSHKEYKKISLTKYRNINEMITITKVHVHRSE
jgi:hypothetical protein